MSCHWPLCLRRFIPAAVLATLGIAVAGCGDRFKMGAPAGDAPAGAERKSATSPEAKAGDPAKTGEAYASIVENPFRLAQAAPLSTFSADVNSASYSNVRRFLTNGSLPPRDAVFLAELVNYFTYRYPQPAGDAPVSLTLDLAPCPWKADHQLARVGVRAKSFEPGEAPRRNLVFLVDTSGSMSPENRLPLVKQSLELLVHQLRDDDQVSVVTYAGDSRVALMPTPGSKKDAILAALHGLRAAGGTNGAGGITKAYELARASFVGGGTNRVVLCTDGDFNVGVVSPSELDQMIERERNSQVFLTVLGFGMGNLKNDRLESLARKGNGHYGYIDTLDEARRVFVEQGAALSVVAKDVKFQVEFNPARVAAYRLLGYENRLLRDEDFKNDKVDAGDLGSGHTVTALYEIVPVGVSVEVPGVDPLKYQAPPQPAGPADEWLTVRMRYKAPLGETSKELSAALRGSGGPAAEDFAFAAAVAEWGLVLRQSEYRGGANAAAALARAEAACGYDPGGHRHAFLDLVRKTMALAAKE
ncbi:vWA domain-containing protein [Urbifossiella limnaea]|uniref:von Willebrand factor n=1 Tax=Urbifossiella limnaea TaxID=2528023 RepID=A0A517XYA8_9BACT|nr:von Willebrand factor type A domain-containing protein [Urbifossiella limnaea]QDU22482.1 von Willebrand factor [Urbifossiella limnaea]